MEVWSVFEHKELPLPPSGNGAAAFTDTQVWNGISLRWCGRRHIVILRQYAGAIGHAFDAIKRYVGCAVARCHFR